ncbi:MAG: insulinase family protein [Bryobacterales bacterium]|nr:insulinase family protein [Bryobacterales bacterium]
MSRIHRLSLCFVLLLCCALTLAPPTALAQAKAWALDATLPLDPAIRTGKLDNGLRYFIRRNTEPNQRAELRLAVNAGSTLEDDDQKGLAHFLEHMMFNGTKRFEKQQLVDFLESTGLRFGPDLNAYTSFEETVYILRVPTDKPEIFGRAFDVLEDWAGAVLFEEEEINKERGVVIEEWRLGQGAQGRLRDKLIPAIFAGSRYKDRLPIGDPDIIRSAPREAFTRFYTQWYRPNLMAVVAVGDFDVDAVEQMIRERFGRLTNPENPRERAKFTLPAHKDTIYTVVTDPELPVTRVQVYFKKDGEETFENVGDYRRSLVRGLFESALNSRLAEITRQPDAPFLGAGVSSSSLVRAGQTYAAQAVAKEGKVLESLEALFTEVARVRVHGFTATEIERMKADSLRSYEQMFQERNNSNSAGFADEYVRHFLEGEPAPGIDVEYQLARQLVPGITVQELNKLAEELITKENRVVVVAMPEKEGLVPPSQAALAKVLEKVEATDLKPYSDTVVDEPLVSQDLAPVPVRQRKRNEALGVTEVVLANGVKVLMKSTDFKQEEVLFTAFSEGGSSLLPDSKYFDSMAADALVALSGVGKFDAVALRKKLAGKSVQVRTSINELGEGLSGSAATGDLETLMELVYLCFTAPRADANALDVFKQQNIASLQNLLSTPQGVFQKTLMETMYGDNVRRRIPTVFEVRSTNLESAAEIYRQRFADANDFTFVFVGSFQEDDLIALCQRYLGNLPVKEDEESFRNLEPELPKGVAKAVARKGVDPQSRVSLTFHGPFEYTRRNRFVIRMMTSVLGIKLREELREDRGGVYGVGASASPSAKPVPRYTLNIGFGCDPQRVEELKAAVMEQLNWLKNAEDMESYLVKVREQERRSFETSLRQNRFWLSTIQFYYEYPDEDPSELLKLPETVDSINADEIRAAARQYLNADRYIDVTLYPENFEVPSKQ